MFKETHHRTRYGFTVEFPNHIINKMAPNTSTCPNLAFL